MSIEFTTPAQADDLIEHEHTFEAFARLIAIAAFHVLTCVVAIALGGIEGRWPLTILWILAATVAAGAGLTMNNVSWKASLAVLALAVVSLI
jgi:hypothetical protein